MSRTWTCSASASLLIADPLALRDKIAQFQSAGIERVCVVSDWDRTLTIARTSDGRDATSYSAIVHGAYLGAVYRREMDRLYARYRPIEVSRTISDREKQNAMRAWWLAAVAMMQQHGLTAAMIADLAARDLIRLRDGAINFLGMLSRSGISLFILSAGLGNVISQFLKVRALLTQNVTVTANQLLFDAHGTVAGFCEPVIHSLNKARHAIDAQGCVLLLGDTLEDAQMVNTADLDCIIRVGFLNESVAENRAEYLRVYDMVICHDAPMTAATELLKTLLNTR